jgi:hypothetical protein
MELRKGRNRGTRTKNQTKTTTSDKRRTRSIDIHLDPEGGHGPASSAFSITVKVAVKDLQRLREYVHTDPLGFHSDLQRCVIAHIPDFPVEKHHGVHAKTHRLEEAIRKQATQIYAISTHWTKRKPKDWPADFSKLITYLTTVRRGQLAHYLQPATEAGCYRPDGIAHGTIVVSPLGKLALRQGMSLSSKWEDELLLLNVANFAKSYIDRSLLKRLNERYALQSDNDLREQMYTLDTRRWLRQVSRKQEYWRTLLNIES